MPVFYINSRMKYGKNVLVGMSVTCQLRRTGGMPTGNEMKLRIP